MGKKFYNIFQDTQTGITTIDIFGDIGGWLGYDDFTFKQALDNAEGDEIIVRINSYGGDVFVGHNIYNMIKQTTKNVKVIVNGVAASIASVIAMAGDTVEMPSNAMLMIHNPSTVVNGTSEDMRKNADVLDKVAKTIKNVYMSRTGLSEAEITAMMDAEVWLTAEEAKEQGFCDVITDEIDIESNEDEESAKILNLYKHVPSKFLNKEDDEEVEKEPKTGTSDLEKRLALLEKRVAKLESQSASKRDPKTTEEDEPKNAWATFFGIK